jgi:putative lipoic acid-binding regulatory protein
MDDPAQSTLEFPCEFPLKVIGKHENDFEALALGIIRRHVPDLNPDTIRRRTSSGGKYLSVTVVFTAQSRAQVDALYIDLSREKRVLWIL